MLLNEFFESLKAELQLLGPRYEAQRFDHPLLASHPSIESVLAKTEPRKEGKKQVVSPEGAAVLCALVDLYRRTRDRLWGAVLLRAFQPMMLAVGKKLVGGSRDERAALLLASFHDAILRVDTARDPLRIAMYIRQETRRGVFRELRKELDWEGIGFGEEADECSDAASFELPPCLKSAGPGGLSRLATSALMSTVCTRGALWNLVRLHYASLSPKEQARIYGRLRQRRRRHVERRRAVCEDLGAQSVSGRALDADRDLGVVVVGDTALDAPTVQRVSVREVQS
jgi:hypothetical protein